MAHSLGTISHLYRFPVKSLAAEPLERAVLDERGLEGDRGSALFVASREHARTGKTYRGKENELLHTVATKDAARDLASARGVALDIRDAGPYFDASPLSLIFDRWVRALEDVVYQPIDPLRFRANVYVAAHPGFSMSEDDLVGRVLTIEGVRLRCTSHIVRCVTPTYDIPTGERDPAIARALAVDLGNVLGIYCAIERGGELALGTAVDLEAPGA